MTVEYCLDADYRSEFWDEFLDSQRIFKAKIMSFVREAYDNGEPLWLQNQMILLGISQAKIKGWLIQHRDEIPKWQKREMKYVICITKCWSRWMSSTRRWR